MNWKKILHDLKAGGMTQEEIARACNSSQSAISDLNRGRCLNPSFPTGKALYALWLRRTGGTAKPATGGLGGIGVGHG